MPNLTLVPGSADTRSYRALALVPTKDPPQIAIAGGPPDAKVVAARVPEPDAIVSALEARGVFPWSIHLRDLSPGAKLRLTVRTAGASKTATVRTLPASLPTEGLTIAVGSCFYRGYHKAAAVGAVLREPWLGGVPALQLWVGDNLYVDVPAEGVGARNQPITDTVERYLAYFNDEVYMDARAASPNFTAYDDHELWNNFPERQAWLARSKGDERAGYIAAGLAGLDLFQSSLNPTPVAGGRAYRFELPPLSFFVADTRTRRERYTGEKSRMMPDEELAALVVWARGLEGPGVLVLGQPYWLGAGGKADRNLRAFGAQFEVLRAALETAQFDVLVISGDVHHSRAIRLGGAFGDIYELVSSPASHIPTVLSSIARGARQGEGDVLLEEPSGGEAALTYELGTSSQNTMALARFTPGGRDSVDVGAAFVDFSGARPTIAALDTKAKFRRFGVRGARANHARCEIPRLWTMRRRAR